MLGFEQSFYKTEKYVFNPALRRYVKVITAPYSPAQYAILGASLEALLGDQFLSWEVLDFPVHTQTMVQYNGLIVDDIETDRNAEIQASYNTWIAEQG